MQQPTWPPYRQASQWTHHSHYIPPNLKLPQNLQNIPDIAWYVPQLKKHAQKNSLCHQMGMMMKKKKTKWKVKTKIKIMRSRPPKNNPRFFVATTLTLQPLKPSITEHFGKRSSVTPENEECKHDTIMMLLGHKDQN